MPATQSKISRPLRILHLSDTHNMHRQIERKFGLPHDVDVVAITGDITNSGDDRAFADFNAWLGEIKARYGYKHILLIVGNHDWWTALGRRESRRVPAKVALNPRYMQAKLTHAHVLSHELVEIEGLRIYGSQFCPWQKAADPDVVAVSSMLPNDGTGHNPFEDIPFGTHIVLTHGPAGGILDGTPHGGHWGASWKLRKELQRKQCLAHLFGHNHAKRGFWVRTSRLEEFSGGCEVILHGRPIYSKKPSPLDSPCLLISGNAMSSEDRPARVVGPGRLIVVELSDTMEGMHFRVVKHSSAEYAGRARDVKVRPALNPTPESTDHFPEVARGLAQHFDVEVALVMDVLATLSPHGHLPAHELSEQAMVMLSGIFDDSDSSSEGDDDTDADSGNQQRHSRHPKRRRSS
jgi:Icc-related predicted phosphoesterase